jgi:predicted DNA-binding protein YlxM (UPF0122 family)
MPINKIEVYKLYDEGITLQKIGNLFGVSKQRIWQIIKVDYDKVKTARHSRANIIKPNQSEIYVYNKLSKLYKNANVNLQPLNSHFDILFNDKKIEVKYANKPKIIGKRQYYRFNYIKSITPVDFYIFVVGDLKSPICYIRPSDELKFNFTHIPLEPIYKSKWQRKYREKWGKYFGY